MPQSVWRRLDAEAEEPEGGEEQDRVGDRERGDRHDIADGVGKDVAADDVPLARAHGRGGLGVLEISDQQRVAADDAGVAPPAGEADDDDEKVVDCAEDRDERDEQEDVGDREEGVDDAHHDRVHDARRRSPRPCRRGADDDRDEAGEEAERQRVLAAEQDAAQFVEARAVGAEPVVRRGRRRSQTVPKVERLVGLVGGVDVRDEVAGDG